MAVLPGVLRDLHPAVVRPFIATAGRLAEVWLADQSDINLSHLLALVKYGLAPAIANGVATTLSRLAAFPHVLPPSLPEQTAQTKDRIKNAISLTEAGFIGKAERALNDEARIAPMNDDTLAKLRSKHPEGEHNPFDAPAHATAMYPDLPQEDQMQRSLASFSTDTAPGSSGWSVKLLRLAAKSPPFLRFLHVYTTSVATGSACGRSLICAARLTPLMKTDGGIRPVAVGELIYRLAMKAIFAANFRKDLLSKHQFGVGSRGGVEPIVQAVHRAAGKDPLFPYTHLFSLDAVNAFNALKRRSLADAVRKHAPNLLRVATWAHNFSAPLILRKDKEAVSLKSSEGVRQGDPMSTLWFSLAIKDTIDALQELLGPDHLVLAYLDDIFVLAPSPDSLPQVIGHFADAPVQLNAAKCKVYDLGRVDEEPIHILGTCIGSKPARERFLLDKVASIETDLNNLRLLPHQHALLVLRKSLQHKLRHLTRQLRSDDLSHMWSRLDASLWNAMDSLRGQIPREQDHRRDRALLSLPTALGGCGILSHKEVAPLAYQAAQATASETLRLLVPRLRPDDDMRSQRELSQEAFLIKQDTLMASLSLRERILVTEAASQIGRRWLDVIPSSSRLRLADSDVRAGLHYRTLLPGSHGPCPSCAAANDAAHDEACQGRPDYRVSRHEVVKHALAAGLKMIPRLQVEIEPFLPDLRRRNDLRISREQLDGTPSLREEYDLKVCVLSAPTNQRALTVQRPPADVSLFKQAFDRVQFALAYHAKRKVMALPDLAPGLPPAPPFFALVLSSGGIMEKGMFEKLKEWKAMASGSVYHSWMLSSISISLVKARGRTFVLA